MNFANEYFDKQRQNDYQRNLIHFRNKNKFKTKKTTRPKQKQVPRSMLLNTSAEQFESSQKYQQVKNLVKIEDLPNLISRMVVKKISKQFISKLKRGHHHESTITTFNSFNNDMAQERRNRNPEQHKFSFTKIEGFIFSGNLNLILHLLTFFSFFYINLLSTFQCFLEQFRLNESGNLWVQVSQLVCVFIILVKIFCQCIIQKSQNGNNMVFIYEITKNYLFSVHSLLDFLLIIFVIFMLEIKDQVYSALLAYFLSLLRIVIIERIDDAIAKHLLLNNKTKQYYSLIRLLLANFFLAHLFGSIFLALASLEVSYNWIIKFGIQNAYWFEQYVYSVYWATTIMVTVGFGDILVSSYVQAIIITIVMLIGCLILSYNITQVASIFRNLMDRSDELQSQLFNLNILKTVSKIDEKLQKKIADYLINSFQIKFRFREEEIKGLVSNLPQNLRQQFIEQSSKAFFQKMPLFYLLKSQTKKLLIQKINMNILPPNQHLTHNSRNRLGFRKIYTLRYGKVGLGYKKRGATINGYIIDTIKVDMGQYPILLNNFLLNRKYKVNYSIICSTFCNIASIQFDQFRQCLCQVTLDFQLWRQIYDSDRALSQELCSKECEQCKQFHSKFNCPRLIYKPLRSVIYLKNIYQKNDFQGQMSIKNKQMYFSFVKSYLLKLRERKKYAKKSPLKYWKRLYLPLEKAQFLSILKQNNIRKAQSEMQNHLPSTAAINLSGRKSKKQKKKFKQFNKFSLQKSSFNQQKFQVDFPYDFDNYFVKDNPKKLVKIDLIQFQMPVNMFKMAST